MRQHINVFSGAAAIPIELEDDWFPKSYESTHLPLSVDLGSARGGFCLNLAKMLPNRNFLGLEVNPVSYNLANERLQKQHAKKKNCTFLKANVHFDLERILTEASQYSIIDQILIQFPDPHFKKRNHKRRMVTPKFAQIIQNTLIDSATKRKCQGLPIKSCFVYLATDVEELAEEMCLIFSQHSSLQPSNSFFLIDDNDHQDQTDQNKKNFVEYSISSHQNTATQQHITSPFQVRTERESAVLAGLGKTSSIKGHVFRKIFVPPPL